ncbi:MAG: transcription elongation factor GreB [Burkholderiaceae bacterium]
MNKAFVKEDTETDDDDLVGEPAVPKGVKNYITPAGYQRIREELLRLIDVERPEVVNIVSWAAGNGDRSENGDYIYGKKRLREIDRRIRFLTKRLEKAEVVDPAAQTQLDRVFFGATVDLLRNGETEETIRIVGIDEVDPANRCVSWISPIARALLKSQIGDEVELQTPAGVDTLEILDVSYGEPDKR